jgi:hypothetical protein
VNPRQRGARQIRRERKWPDNASRSDAREEFDRVPEIAQEPVGSRLSYFVPGKNREREHALGVEPGMHLRERLQARAQKRGADAQNQRERELQHHQGTRQEQRLCGIAVLRRLKMTPPSSRSRERGTRPKPKSRRD